MGDGERKESTRLTRLTLQRFNAGEAVACLLLTSPVNSAYGRTGNATEAKPRVAASSVAAAATEPAHSPDAAARTAQPGSTGDGNKSRAGRVAGGFRRRRTQRD